jgi:drug/metabolite transporter (DMT)-like permease
VSADRARAVALLKVTVAVVAWGASFIATKVALRDLHPVTVVWTRFLMGVLVLGATVLSRRELRAIPLRDLGYFALLGFIGITFHQWLQSNGLVTAQASTTAWIVASTPVFIALLGHAVLRERLRGVEIGGIALAAVGVILVATRGDLAQLTRGRFGAPGDLLVLISAPNWAIFSVLSRRALRDQPAGRMMFYVMTLGWLFTTGLVFAGPGPALRDLPALDPAGWTAVVFLGVVCSGLAYVYWYDALRTLPASQAGAFLYLEPLVAVVVAWAVLGEPLGAASLLGGGIILLGVWLVSRSSSASAPTPSRRSGSPSPRRSGANPSPSSTPPSSSSRRAGS